MAILGFELEEIARLIALVEEQGLEEIIIEEDGRFLRIRGHLAAASAPPQAAAVPQAVLPVARLSAPSRAIMPPKKPDSSSELQSGQKALTSPMMGVFYRAEKPGAPPVVNIGDRVSVGQTVGILEAMKVFSEFKSDFAGVVVAISAQDGQLVHNGTTLMVLQTE